MAFRMKRGFSQIEMLATAAILLLAVGMGLQGFISISKAQKTTTGLPAIQEDCIGIVTMITDDLKEAPACTATSGCTTNSVVETATASSITFYVTSTGTKRTFRLNNGKFERLEGSSNTPSYSMADVTGLTFRYLTIDGGTYNATAMPTNWATTVTGTSVKNITVIRVTVEMSRNGVAGTYTTDFRLRNSPYIP